MPRARHGRTYAFKINDLEGYATANEFPDGRVGELFLVAAKQGSTLSGILDMFAIAISFGLQHGVPLEAYVRKFAGQKFEPHGTTDDQELSEVESIVDYVFRRLALDYLPELSV